VRHGEHSAPRARLRNAEFEPDSERVWRWVAEHDAARAIVKFELLADLPDAAAASTIVFESCENLGAVNLRGPGSRHATWLLAN